MRRKAVPYLLLAAGIALLVLVNLALQRMPNVREPEETPEAAAAPIQVLFDEGESPVRVTLQTGARQTAYVFDAESGIYAAEGYDERLAFDQAALKRLFDSLSRITSRKRIDTHAEQVYGLDDPACVVTAEYAGGAEHVVRVGARSPLEDGYFGTADAEQSVYLLQTYDVDSFLKTLEDYRALTLMHDFDGDAQSYSLTIRELVIDRGAGDRLVLRRREDGANGEVYGIRIVEPVPVEGDEYAVSQLLGQPLISLKNAKLQLVEDLPQDLTRYGLDTPRLLTLRDDAGETTLLVGAQEDGRTYLMREGVPAVLSVRSAAVSFLNVDYAQVMDRLIWLYNIDDIGEVRIDERGGGTDILLLNDDGTFDFNGQKKDDEAARTLYRNVISLTYEGRADAQSSGAETPDYTLTLSLKDGREEKLALYAINERHYAVERNGEMTGFYLNKSGLQEIWNAMEALK